MHVKWWFIHSPTACNLALAIWHWEIPHTALTFSLSCTESRRGFITKREEEFSPTSSQNFSSNPQLRKTQNFYHHYAECIPFSMNLDCCCEMFWVSGSDCPQTSKAFQRTFLATLTTFPNAAHPPEEQKNHMPKGLHIMKWLWFSCSESLLFFILFHPRKTSRVT